MPGFETGSKSLTKEISQLLMTRSLLKEQPPRHFAGTENSITGNQLVVDSDKLGPHEMVM